MKLKIPSKHDGFQPMFLESGDNKSLKENVKKHVNSCMNSKLFLGLIFVWGAIGLGLSIPALIQANNNEDNLHDLQSSHKVVHNTNSVIHKKVAELHECEGTSNNLHIHCMTEKFVNNNITDASKIHKHLSEFQKYHQQCNNENKTWNNIC